ncbi:hypothetical protein Clacol_005242 [Clathrus columnatus]|uniref:Uncharacterized protein n=1 Tax=Clathrus columnatus TaxID=1419009 RepID=A0AAV5AC07_9AGAM|nr:hypothetical protein Clacol_005242 [Clathrus columnatus]
MAAVIQPGRYSIQSVMFPGLVLDLQGGGILPGTPIIAYNKNDTPNQIACLHLTSCFSKYNLIRLSNFQWSLAHIHPPVANTTFTLRAEAPASYIFAPNVIAGTGIDGSPLALSLLEAHPVAGGGPNVFQIIALSQPGDSNLAFTAPGPNSQVELQASNPVNLAQRWTFTLLPLTSDDTNVARRYTVGIRNPALKVFKPLINARVQNNDTFATGRPLKIEKLTFPPTI